MEYTEKNGTPIKVYKINDDGTKSKAVISIIRKKKYALVILCIEVNDKPKLNIYKTSYNEDKKLIFNDLERAL